MKYLKAAWGEIGNGAVLPGSLQVFMQQWDYSVFLICL